MKNLFLLFCIITMPGFVFGQLNTIQWERSYGGSDWEAATSIQQTSDSGYIIAGSTESFDSEVAGNHGGIDYWVVKITKSGDLQWQKTLGGSQKDWATSIQQTFEGGYIVCGYSNSLDGDITGHIGDTSVTNVWIVKLSDSGTIQWQESLGGGIGDYGKSIQQTFDSGYIVAGYTLSWPYGPTDCLILKLSQSGSIQWQHSYGGSGSEEAYSIQQTPDTGYIFAGFSSSNDGDVSGNHGDPDFWVVKLTSSGSITWQKSLGGSSGEYANSVTRTPDGGYIVAGTTYSDDGDVIGNHGYIDYWVVKLSSVGNLEWQKCFGGSYYEFATSVQNSPYGGYLVAGYTHSIDSEITLNHGMYDYWVLHLSDSGDIIWQKTYGGSNEDYANCIQTTYDGEFIIAGGSANNNGDVTGNHGNWDFWIVKAGPATIPDTSVPTVNHIINNYALISISPNPTTGYISVISPYKVDILVCNLFGQLIKEARNTDNISVAEFPSGMYFIKLLNESGELIFSGKIVKE